MGMVRVTWPIFEFWHHNDFMYGCSLDFLPLVLPAFGNKWCKFLQARRPLVSKLWRKILNYEHVTCASFDIVYRVFGACCINVTSVLYADFKNVIADTTISRDWREKENRNLTDSNSSHCQKNNIFLAYIFTSKSSGIYSTRYKFWLVFYLKFYVYHTCHWYLCYLHF